jgi:hypothetical protein
MSDHSYKKVPMAMETPGPLPPERRELSDRWGPDQKTKEAIQEIEVNTRTAASGARPPATFGYK